MKDTSFFYKRTILFWVFLSALVFLVKWPLLQLPLFWDEFGLAVQKNLLLLFVSIPALIELHCIGQGG